MKRKVQWIMAVLLLMAQGAWATAEPSQTLTEIRKMGECTVYSFNYPSVSATGQPIVLSSALFAWTPANRQTTDSIESLHIFSHITITADDECLTTTSGLSKEQSLLLFLPGRSYNYPLGGEQADNSVITGWEPKHRIQFFHSKTDVIVPYGNYLSFRDAHPQGEGTLFRINDTFSTSDHMDAGAALLMEMLTLKSYGAYFNWLCEGSTTSVSEELRVKSEEFLSPEGESVARNATAAEWYTLDGRRLSGKPSQKGIYIYQGKKVIMK